MLLVLVAKPLDTCGGVFVVGGDMLWGRGMEVGIFYMRISYHGYIMFMLRWMCGMCVGFSTKQLSLIWGCR